MLSRVQRLACVLLTVILGLEPFSIPSIHAATVDRSQTLALVDSARRMDVDPLFLSDPNVYLAREAQAAIIRRDAALAGLDQTYRPSVETLAKIRTLAESVKDSHAASAFG